MRYRFLEEHKGEYRPIRKACEILGVSKSGYYEFRNRRKSNQQIEREALEGFVVEVFNEHKARYGYSRINRELRKIGITVSEKRVLGIMSEEELSAITAPSLITAVAIALPGLNSRSLFPTKTPPLREPSLWEMVPPFMRETVAQVEERIPC